MKINEIKAALAQMAQKMEPVTAPSVISPKVEAETSTQVASNKNTATATSANHSSSVPVASQQTTRKPSTKKPTVTTTATPAPVTKDIAPLVTAPVKVLNQPMVDQETKPVAVAPKKTTTRKTKTAATVIPLDSIEIVVAKYLKAVDYSLIPGCGRKPVLLKAGAEKLAEIYGLRTTSKVINRVERFDQLFVLYEVQTTVYDADGNIVAEGLGSCNSKERRYQKGDFAANLNTVLKMAKKRSYVDAVLTATHASCVFTQDIEDIGVEKTEAVG